MTATTIYQKQSQVGRLDDAGTFPKVVLIDTVSFCNLRCSMCVHPSMTRPKGYMSDELFRKIVDEIAEEDPSIRVWMVFFGEALILRRHRPTIFDKIRYAKQAGLTDVVMNSNANLLDREAARTLIESGLDAVYIGIDAFHPETYARVRVGGDYQRVVENTKHLLRLKEELKSATPEVYVQFVEMDCNTREKEDFIAFWNDQGATVKIRPKVSWAGLIEAPNLTLGEQDRWPCYWAMQSMSITDRGKVVTCAVDLDARYVAGDLNQSTIKEVWNGPLKRLRELHKAGEYSQLPAVCRDCRDWQSARADFHAVN